MDSKFLLIGGAVVLVLLGGWYWSTSSQQNNELVAPNEVVETKTGISSLTLSKRILTPNMVTVTQGDQVTIKVTSDEAGEFHVSGYEIENDMTAGSELSFSFTADKAGRYNFELHPKAEGGGEAHDTAATGAGGEEEDIVIGAFVVNPR